MELESSVSEAPSWPTERMSSKAVSIMRVRAEARARRYSAVGVFVFGVGVGRVVDMVLGVFPWLRLDGGLYARVLCRLREVDVRGE